MEANDIKEYVTLCRLLGPWTDWVQGPGGNISVKSWDHSSMIIKRSGALLADTTPTQGWVVCNLGAVQRAFAENREDIAHTIDPTIPYKGHTGKPSIETFMHCLPARIVVHLHPAPLLPQLCHTAAEYIPYKKPGIPLAREILAAHARNPQTAIFCMANHGILVTGNTMSEILGNLSVLRAHFITNTRSLIPQGNIAFCTNLFFGLKAHTGGQEFLIQPVGNWEIPRPLPAYTPDIAVFLEPAWFSERSTIADILRNLNHAKPLPTVIRTEAMTYVMGTCLEQCSSLREILMSVLAAEVMGAPPNALTAGEVAELRGWDKEKERLRLLVTP